MFWKECYDIRKRTCKVVCVHSEKFTTERAGEGIQNAGRISVYQISQAAEKINVLGIHIKNKRTSVSERMKATREIYAEHNENGGQEAEKKI